MREVCIENENEVPKTDFYKGDEWLHRDLGCRVFGASFL